MPRDEGRLALRQADMAGVIKSKLFTPDATRFSEISLEIQANIIALLLQVISGPDVNPILGKRSVILRQVGSTLQSFGSDGRNRAREFMERFTDRKWSSLPKTET